MSKPKKSTSSPIFKLGNIQITDGFDKFIFGGTSGASKYAVDIPFDAVLANETSITAKYEPADAVTFKSFEHLVGDLAGTFNIKTEAAVDGSDSHLFITNKYIHTNSATTIFNDDDYKIRFNYSDNIVYSNYSNYTAAHDIHDQRSRRRYAIPRRKRTSLHRAQPNEEKARRLLQRLVGFRRFARYIRDGFVTHKGKSGRVFQIYPGHQHMKVWENGEHIESWCLCIKDGQIPPTDSVVMRLLMLEHSEEQFKELANVSNYRRNVPTIYVDTDQYIFRVNDNVMAEVA